jgi:hypothetical protein
MISDPVFPFWFFSSMFSSGEAPFLVCFGLFFVRTAWQNREKERNPERVFRFGQASGKEKKNETKTRAATQDLLFSYSFFWLSLCDTPLAYSSFLLFPVLRIFPEVLPQPIPFFFTFSGLALSTQTKNYERREKKKSVRN